MLVPSLLVLEIHCVDKNETTTFVSAVMETNVVVWMVLDVAMGRDIVAVLATN